MRSSIVMREIKLQRRHHTLTKTLSVVHTIVTKKDLAHISREFIYTFVAGKNFAKTFLNLYLSWTTNVIDRRDHWSII